MAQKIVVEVSDKFFNFLKKSSGKNLTVHGMDLYVDKIFYDPTKGLFCTAAVRNYFEGVTPADYLATKMIEKDDSGKVDSEDED